MSHYFQPRCCHCGKFIAFQQIQEDEAVIIMTPDSAYSSEQIEYLHRECRSRGSFHRIVTVHNRKPMRKHETN